MEEFVMATDTTAAEALRDEIPIIALDLPVMYEDEGQDEIGETDLHFESLAILRYGLRAHLASQPQYRVFSDLNLYYHRLDVNAYVSPDCMVVAPDRDLGEQITSYLLGRDGPAPVLTAEVLSRRSHQQQDLTNKTGIYAQLGVAEYILVDVTGQFLPQRLLLKRLEMGGVWRDEQDADGGVTGRLGFRLVIEEDGQLRVVNARTGERYARPNEADQQRQARERAEAQVKALQSQLEQLRRQASSSDDSTPPESQPH
jgi:Uma2 family endonuclease